jgi:ABC-type branched-subunit amino acid transport system ATPase component
MSEAVLRIDGLQTYYGKIHALRGISLSVQKGQIVTLLGANGAGKSTTPQDHFRPGPVCGRQDHISGQGHHHGPAP